MEKEEKELPTKHSNAHKMSSDVVRWPWPSICDHNSIDRSKCYYVNSQRIRDSKSSFYKLMLMWLVINVNVNVALSEQQLNAVTDDYRSPLSADVETDEPLLIVYEIDDTNDIDGELVLGDFTPTWAVHIPGGEAEANRVAEEHGYKNLGKVC